MRSAISSSIIISCSRTTPARRAPSSLSSSSTRISSPACPRPIRRAHGQIPPAFSLHAGHAHAHGRLFRRRGAPRARPLHRQRSSGSPRPCAKRCSRWPRGFKAAHDRVQGFSAELPQIAAPRCARPAMRGCRACRARGSTSISRISRTISDQAQPQDAQESPAANIARPPPGRPSTMEVVSDIEPHIDEIFPLYQQVLERSQYKFEELTKSYFVQLGRRMGDRAVFFIWRAERQGRRLQFLRRARRRPARPLHRPRLQRRARASPLFRHLPRHRHLGASRTATTPTTARRSITSRSIICATTSCRSIFTCAPSWNWLNPLFRFDRALPRTDPLRSDDPPVRQRARAVVTAARAEHESRHPELVEGSALTTSESQSPELILRQLRMTGKKTIAVSDQVFFRPTTPGISFPVKSPRRGRCARGSAGASLHHLGLGGSRRSPRGMPPSFVPTRFSVPAISII